MNKFYFLTGDVNYRQYGGKWYRKINDTVYHVIELINMWDATGELEQPQYNVSLSEIDLTIADIKSALECREIEFTSTGIEPLLIVECVSDYGQVAPMGNYGGNNYLKLLQQAKQESYKLDDNDYHLRQLARPVNKLGSTALEFAAGDFTSALIRGIANNDPSARIMGKIHGLSQDDMNSIKDDEYNKTFSLNPVDL